MKEVHRVRLVKVRVGEIVNWNGNCVSMKTTCLDINTWLVLGSRHLYAWVSREYPTKTQG